MSEKKGRRYNKSVYRSFAMVMQFGLNMVVPIGIMSAIGVFLDRKLGTSWIMILFFFAGAIAGGQNIYRMAKQVFDEKKPEDESLIRKTDSERSGRERPGKEKTGNAKEQEDACKNKQNAL